MTEARHVRLPDKAAGGVYAVILRSHDFSWGRLIAAGAVGGEGAAPLPAVADDKCTCCDAPTARRQTLDPSSDRIQADPIALPVCEACKGHALRNTSTEAMLGIGTVTLLALGGYGVMNRITAAAIGGFAAAAALVAFLIVRRGRRKALARGGHHAGLEISVRPGQTSVRTSNRRVVEELVARDGARIVRII